MHKYRSSVRSTNTSRCSTETNGSTPFGTNPVSVHPSNVRPSSASPGPPSAPAAQTQSPKASCPNGPTLLRQDECGVLRRWPEATQSEAELFRFAARKGELAGDPDRRCNSQRVVVGAESAPVSTPAAVLTKAWHILFSGFGPCTGGGVTQEAYVPYIGLARHTHRRRDRFQRRPIHRRSPLQTPYRLITIKKMLNMPP